MDIASFGIVGLETMLALSLNLVHSGHMSLREVMASMTYKAADIIHADAGRLRIGAPADLALIDPNYAWTITNESLHSKSKNSPFDGLAARGRALRTVVGGESVFRL
jgi:dihydroorotase